MKKILGIIVTYFPEKKLLIRNVEAIIRYVDKLIIWENTTENKEAFRFVSGSNIEYFSEGRNVGISKALNFGWKYAQKEGFDYILTMDQDSIFINFQKYLITSFAIANDDSIVFGPLVTVDKKEEPSECINELAKNQYLITSGMLVPTKVLQTIEGYRETFLIDGIDVDFCIRVQDAGFKIYKNHNGILLQHFGIPSVYKLLGKEYICSNYSPFRYYGILRNHIIIYRCSHRLYVKKLVKTYFFHFLPRIILWESNKIKKVWYMAKGIVDGIRYNI